MDDKILEQCRMLDRYTGYLREISMYPKGEFADSFLLIGSAERYLQLAIESCINIGNRLLSIVQMNKTVKAPETYADIFAELGKLGVLQPDFVDVMITMIRFRNRVVHMYWDIDPGQLYSILKNNLGDFGKFKEDIIRYMNFEHI